MSYRCKMKGIRQVRILDDELHHVLWAYRMTLKISMGEMFFSLAFGTETVIPIKMKISLVQDATYEEKPQNNF